MLREEKISRPRFFLFFLTGLLLAVLLAAMPDRRPVAAAIAPEVREGDIIFHASTSSQSALIRLLTRSPYTHCGLVMRHKGRWLVLEAVQPVKLTPLAAWTARGAGGHYVLKRLKNADAALTPDVLERMRRLGLGMLGRAYDRQFRWSDAKLYCSELVWKLYRRGAGITLCKPQHFRDFNPARPSLAGEAARRYGKNMPPPDEPVVTPAALYDSPLLRIVREE
ncbi:YiiX family permuted papain-like enzyme [Desulfovibrio fairfieldensis]|uniref:Peptidoglycan peptidase n=1 Tax=Desulfovibrio fairfieldensis TaxID=44742 RepID=A0A0X8JLZ3_9BACT|nr:YiiX family permuted papain-like enzyme [Desulfovibrio fairfieldensis]AMD91194.1 hypothetical protein AXF13_14260 [Desulfovibrio fairfieldensis]